MKLLKVGKSPACDIVLNSDFVSSHHADITVLDNGDIILEDKNSTNGTYVGNNKINPNQEVTIKRGDYVRFGNTDLPWNRVPAIENNSQYKKVVNIGSNFRNDIIVNAGTVSRYHATLKIAKGGKAFIQDNDSKNGTQVNGVRIQANKPVRIKKNDNVIIGGEDITEQLKTYLGSSSNAWTWVAGIAAAVVVVVAGWFIVKALLGPTPEDLSKAVVYVRAGYHFEVTLEDDPVQTFGKEIKIRYPETGSLYGLEATAFFIDRDGRMGTNRHVAVPWEYNEDERDKAIQAFNELFVDQLKVDRLDLANVLTFVNSYELLNSTSLGQLLLTNCQSASELNARIDRIQRSKVVVKGVMDYISVAYPGVNLTHQDELKRCYPVCDSGDKNIDVAILQLNDKHTPDNIKYVFDVKDIYEGTVTPLKDKLVYIGYPQGLEWGLENSSLQPSIKASQCSKTPDKYGFEFNATSTGGCSGSPIFIGKDNLVGILYGGYEGQPVTMAVHAHYLKKLYEKAVGKYADK